MKPDEVYKVRITNQPISLSWVLFVAFFLISFVRGCVEDITLTQAFGRTAGELIVAVEHSTQRARMIAKVDSSARQIMKEKP